MNLPKEKVLQYFEARLGGKLNKRGDDQFTAKCPFHHDRVDSLSINVSKAVWKCHAGCGDGGLLDFEEEFSVCNREQAAQNIREVTGEQFLFNGKPKPDKVYEYVDEQGRLLFQAIKIHLPDGKKRFSQRKPKGNGEWDYKLGDVRRVLYRLPEVITANLVAICEGEKDCDNLVAANPWAGDGKARFTATTNPHGAGKWTDVYAPYFAGKFVVIFPDNDDVGRAHAEAVAQSVTKYAAAVKVVSLPDVPEKGDVSDYLAQHTPDELKAIVNAAPRWRQAGDTENPFFVDAPQAITRLRPDIDWLVQGLIQRGANGFICANPKVGKSWVAIDLALSLSLGQPFLGMPTVQSKVALVSREDAPGLTFWRMRNLLRGRAESELTLQGRLKLNTKEQRPLVMLDDPLQYAEMVDEVEKFRPDLILLDVFNVLHNADENDNTEMRSVLQRLTDLQARVGCSIGVVHHFNKYGEGTMTQRVRGSSAISGWVEWLWGIDKVPDDHSIRRFEVEMKVAQPPDPFYYRVHSDEQLGISRLELVDYEPPVEVRRGRTA